MFLNLLQLQLSVNIDSTLGQKKIQKNAFLMSYCVAIHFKFVTLEKSRYKIDSKVIRTYSLNFLTDSRNIQKKILWIHVKSFNTLTHFLIFTGEKN